MKSCYLNALGMVCSLGANLVDIGRNLMVLAQSGVASSEQFSPGRPLPVGRVSAPLPSVDDLPVCQRSRNNQLALAALAQIRMAVDKAVEKFGAERCGVIIGTSTSGIAEGEMALQEYVVNGKLPETFHYGQQELNSPAALMAAALGVSGPAYVNSSACASSAKALASAARLLSHGSLRCGSRRRSRFLVPIYPCRIRCFGVGERNAMQSLEP